MIERMGMNSAMLDETEDEVYFCKWGMTPDVADTSNWVVKPLSLFKADAAEPAVPLVSI